MTNLYSYLVIIQILNLVRFQNPYLRVDFYENSTYTFFK